MIIFPNIGWHFLTVSYISIFVLQILFYYLTTDYVIKWQVFSFIINFILWTFEQVQIEKYYQDTFIYKNQSKIVVCLLGGFLWVTNKILIEIFLKKVKLLTKRIKN